MKVILVMGSVHSNGAVTETGVKLFRKQQSEGCRWNMLAAYQRLERRYNSGPYRATIKFYYFKIDKF